MGDRTPEPSSDPDQPHEVSPWSWLAQPLPGHGSRSDRTWAVVTHLSIFVLGIAFPLAVVLVRGHRSPYVCHQAVEVLNFHTTVLLAVLVCSMASVTLVGAAFLPVVVVGAGVLAVRGAVHASRGDWHRYPLTLRLIS